MTCRWTARMVAMAGCLICLAAGHAMAGQQSAPESAAAGSQGTPPAPYKAMLSDPLTFSGFSNGDAGYLDQPDITIGLFVPDDEDNPAGTAIVRGAELAVDLANRSGGWNGRPFRLVRRWAESPWAGGSAEMIRLLRNEKAVAVLSFMSAASHIAEQVAVKLYIPVLTPVSSDPSLTQARVPWIFRLPPDDTAQAELIVNACIRETAGNGIGLITSTNQDSRMATGRLLKALTRKGTAPVFHIQLNESSPDINALLDRLAAASPEALIIKVSRAGLETLLGQLKEAGCSSKLFIPWTPGIDRDALAGLYPFPIVYVEPFAMDGNADQEGNEAIAAAYESRYKDAPSHISYYAFDAVRMIIRSICAKGDLSRSGIRDSLVDLRYQGLAGSYAWDSGGGNTAAPVLTRINQQTFSPIIE